MGELGIGQQVGTWKSNAGEAKITVKKEIGSGYDSYDAAVKAAYGKQAVITHEKDGKVHTYEVDDGAYLDDLDLGEHVKADTSNKKVTVLDFVGDDGYQLNAGQKTYPPIGPDNGKVVYFFRHFSKSAMDTVMNHVTDSARRWNEEIEQARKKGYTVILDPHASESDMQKAFHNPKTAGIVYNGHGNKDGVVVDDGKGGWKIFDSNSVEKDKVSKNLKLVVFQSCDTGKGADNWADVTHGAKIAGWKKKVPAGETAASNDPALFATLAGAATMSPAVGLATYYLIPNKLGKLFDDNL